MLPGHFPSNLIFALVLIATLAFFTWTVRRLIAIIKLGKPDPRGDNMGQRRMAILTHFFGQRSVLKEPAGIGHFFIFWGFIILSLATLETFIRGFASGFRYDMIFGAPLTQLFGLLLDLFGLAVLAAIVVALLRRFVQKPRRLESDDSSGAKDAALILTWITALVVLMFLSRAVEARLFFVEGGRDWVPSMRWAFLSRWIEEIFRPRGDFGLKVLVSLFWWAHTLLILGFLAYIPYSKHLHILMAAPNMMFRRLPGEPKAKLAGIDFTDAEATKFGKDEMADLSWKQILDHMACTECGR